MNINAFKYHLEELISLVGKQYGADDRVVFTCDISHEFYLLDILNYIKKVIIEGKDIIDF